MANQEKILVIRFSAMGDVAMTAPVIEAFIRVYPEKEIVMVSRAAYQTFFTRISRPVFHSFDPKGRHKGFFGLVKLFLELRAHGISHVADLHNNLRSRVLCLLFFLTGVKVVSVNKGRAEKKRLTRKRHKKLIPLKPTIMRYVDVFEKLGFPFLLEDNLQYSKIKKLGSEQWIGVSPFAQHKQKVYPLHKMEVVILELAGKGYKLYIFGGSIEEAEVADNWASKHVNIHSMVKKISLIEELKFIAQLDVMLSMDSSGMHLASLVGVPVVSVWGATHPYAGFLGYGQSLNDVVQIDLYCRPCSVYGNIPCYRGDFACMNNLQERDVIDRVLDKLNNHETTLIN